jgi:hypothetical protein
MAKEIFLHLQAHGWEQTIARYRPQLNKEKKRDITVGGILIRSEGEG